MTGLLDGKAAAVACPDTHRVVRTTGAVWAYPQVIMAGTKTPDGVDVMHETDDLAKACGIAFDVPRGQAAEIAAAMLRREAGDVLDTTDVRDAAAYASASAAEEQTWAAYCSAFRQEHGEESNIPAADQRIEAQRQRANRSITLGPAREWQTQAENLPPVDGLPEAAMTRFSGEAQRRLEHDLYAARAEAQQRHPSYHAPCGQIVGSTRMPCHLATGHRGRHRSR